MSLIRSGMARRLCGNRWSHILRELHTRERDLLNTFYLHAINNAVARDPSKAAKLHIPFSDFGDSNGYAGFYPSARYLNSVYVNHIIQIRSILDQCQSSLTGAMLKWDHSFKVSRPHFPVSTFS